MRAKGEIDDFGFCKSEILLNVYIYHSRPQGNYTILLNKQITALDCCIWSFSLLETTTTTTTAFCSYIWSGWSFFSFIHLLRLHVSSSWNRSLHAQEKLIDNCLLGTELLAGMIEMAEYIQTLRTVGSREHSRVEGVVQRGRIRLAEQLVTTFLDIHANFEYMMGT